jgi:hypothetical protein
MRVAALLSRLSVTDHPSALSGIGHKMWKSPTKNRALARLAGKSVNNINIPIRCYLLTEADAKCRVALFPYKSQV